MKLGTAYEQDWYDIVEQVCSQRKRKERCDRDLVLAKRMAGWFTLSNFVNALRIEIHSLRHQLVNLSLTMNSRPPIYAQVSSSPSFENDKLSPEVEVPRLKNGNDGSVLEHSATASAQVSSSPSLEDKLSPEEEFPRLRNGNDGLVLQVTGQHGQVSHEVSQDPEILESANQLPHTFPVENGDQVEELLLDDIWALVDAMPLPTSAEIEHPETGSELESFCLELDLESVGLEVQPREPVQDYVQDDSFETTNASNARESKCPGRMEKPKKKRARGSNWNHAQTMALAELKRDASCNKEDGPLVWERIAQTLSSRFPDQIRKDAQCRRRWDTLVKVYSHIEDYCVQTGQYHWELDEGELASMKLETAYQQDWYDIVEQVCSQRKRKGKRSRGWRLFRRTKESNGSHSVEVPNRLPNMLVKQRMGSNGFHRTDGLPDDLSNRLANQNKGSNGSHSVEVPDHLPNMLAKQSMHSSMSCSRTDNLSDDFAHWLSYQDKGSNGSHYVEVPTRFLDMLGKLSMGSNGIHIADGLPDGLSNSYTKPVTHHKQLSSDSSEPTSASAQVSSSPSLEADKLSPEEEVPRLKNGEDGFMLEATPLQQHGQITHQVSQEPQTLESAEYGAQLMAWLKVPLQDDLWDSVDTMPFETSPEIEQSETKLESTEPFKSYLESVGLGAQPKELLQDHEQDVLHGIAIASSAFKFEVQENKFLDYYMESGPYPDYRTLESPRSDRTTMGRTNAITPLDGSRMVGCMSRNNLAASRRSSVFVSQDGPIPSANMTSSTSSRSADSTIRRQSRRWSLKVIVLNVLQCCHACGRKERAEDMEMELKQAAQLEEKARKKALMSRKENVPAMLNATNSTSATSATTGDEPLQKDTERIIKQAALDKKEEETMPSSRAERQQVGGKSSSKCVPVGKWCAQRGAGNSGSRPFMANPHH